MESLCRFTETMGSLLSNEIFEKIVSERELCVERYQNIVWLNRACFLTFYLFGFIFSSQNHFISFYFPNNFALRLNPILLSDLWFFFFFLLLYFSFPSWSLQKQFCSSSCHFTATPVKRKYSGVPIEVLCRSGQFADFMHRLSIILRDMFVLWYCRIYLLGL